ncbi:MAG: TaqI-like C-terminal specificity domain-containing protein, partial [Methanobacteriaceae archaeon]|nr:TaqI-like C-terminal specificity domain-containing protein [Methanobacteriaceae archaeon]
QINNRSQANLFASDAQIKLKKLKEIHELFFNAESPNKKKKLRKEIENIEWEFIEETLKGEGNEKAIEKLQEYKKNKSKPFFLWKLYFAEIFRRDNPGFDIVIANPPYVRMELITEFKPYFKRNYQVFASRADIYTYFFEKGLNILRKNGILTFICSNKFTRANYGKSLRKLILKNELKIYDDYPGIKIFDDATVDPCTILIKKGLSKRNNILVNREFMIPQNRFSTDSWDFDDPIILDLRDIIKTKGKQISIFHDSKIMYGVKTGYMDAFIIDDNDMKCLIGQDIKCKEIIRSFLRGRDVRKWKISPQNLHIILVEHGKGQFLEKEYPVIYKYLNQYSEKLKNRGQVKNGQHHWLELDNNPSREFLNEFENEKIIWAEIAESPQFTVDSLGYYCETSNFIMNRPKDYDLYYIVSLLNSNLLHFQFNGIASTLGKKGSRYKKIFVEQLTIANASFEQQNNFKQKAIKIILLNNNLISEIQAFKNILETEFNLNKYSKKLESYYQLSFEEFLIEIKKKRVDIESNESFLKEIFDNSICKIEP